ncbi:10527_t:CDS:2 [Diversispora eburnea]|uniref:10527_t:CDS:1 n=1 Tax=Diversispora eburnea TaxID=1213867 RepID=A0A9N9FRG7_9GLOM|nr:10527_t:CDS:2 [Diversispora eburnea]
MVSNNKHSTDDTRSENSEISTPTPGKSDSGIESPSESTNKFPGKDLPPPTIEQTPTRFLASCSKLDLEPNPFEQSFSGVAPITENAGTSSPKPSLPPLSQLASPGLPPDENQYGWNLQSLRSGALSPSMLAGPQETIIFDNVQSTGRTGTTPLSFVPYPEPSPRSAALLGAATTSFNPMISLSTPANPSDSFVRNVFGSGVSRITENDRVMSTLPSNLLNMSNATSAPSSSSTNVMVTNTLNHQTSVLLGNSAINNLNNRNVLKVSTQDIINRIPETIMPKTEKEDLVHSNNNNVSVLNNGRQSNGINAHKPLSPLSDSMDEDSVPLTKMGNLNILKSGSRGARRKAEEQLINDHSQKKHGQKVKNEMTDEEKRRNFLERNPALKCRQRKKQWLANLQAKVEFLTNDNETLQNQAQSLREEIINLKTLLLAHKDCPIAQANGVIGLDSIPPSNHGIPTNVNGMNIGPNGIPMGIVQSGNASMQGNGTSGNMPMTNVQVPQHMSNHVTGPPDLLEVVADIKGHLVANIVSLYMETWGIIRCELKVTKQK